MTETWDIQDMRLLMDTGDRARLEAFATRQRIGDSAYALRRILDLAEYAEAQGVVGEHGRLEERDWQGLVAIQNDTIEALRDAVSFHQKKAKEWLTAYQASRCKCVGDYTRLFVRRPRMRRLIAFLMRL